jgi:hypothetical protein
VLGIDRFYRSSRSAGTDKLDQEGLVPVHWSPLEPHPVDGWADARKRLRNVLERAVVLPDPHDRDWLSEQTLSLSTLVRWVAGESLAYEEVVAGTLRIDPRPPSARALRRAREARDAAVAEAGYADYAAYVERDLVPAGEVGTVMADLIGQARARTEERLSGLRLAPDTIGVKAVAGTAFSAYCDYPGRAVWVNTDIPFTRAGLKHLVAHEAYPGHDAHMSHRDALVRSGAMLPDAALVITNTASSVLFEGIAERGLDLLEWRDQPTDRVAWAHDRLAWLASIEVAHGLNTARLTAQEARHFLRTYGDADEAWIDAKLRFVTHGLRAPFVYTYWWGGTVVGRWWRHVRAARRDQAVRHLYDRMHSPGTLIAHADGEEPNDAI